MNAKQSKQRIGIRKGMDSIIQDSRKKKKMPQKREEVELRISYGLPKGLVKRIRQVALNREMPAKEVVRQTLEKHLPKQ